MRGFPSFIGPENTVTQLQPVNVLFALQDVRPVLCEGFAMLADHAHTPDR
jgi:hypothetical protein